jgi:hypothetical protein
MVAARSKARSDAVIEGSTPTYDMDVWCVCVCIYSVLVSPCIYVEALRRADHSSKESYPLCIDGPPPPKG